ncbi:prenyltransferase [Chaetomium strumarium]|uniref:Prenyltransferase n=1 Tax=Chaetomium strumarium TaxID=1170767 RepID=A0AAJ0GMF4_9PEZI|nr:prenyltransferase [Chaetomium strumarium]
MKQHAPVGAVTAELRSRSPNVNTKSDQADAADTALSQQYGGRHVGGWVSHLPASWVPFVQLARLSPPAALALIYFPHLFGALLSAITYNSDSKSATHGPAPAFIFLRASAVLLLGSFFFSNAAHAWNDLIDAPLDAQVARTRKRPIPRGAITPRAAFVFAATQAVCAAGVLLFAFPDPVGAACYALPNVLATAYYPWAKRHTNLVQLVLGFCLAWGIVVGFTTVGLEPFTWRPYFGLGADARREVAGDGNPIPSLRVDVPAACLLLACVLWTTIYDTIYAHQDRKDDTKLGIRSMAVLYGDRTKPVLWLALFCMLGLLAGCGAAAGMAWPYFGISLAGCALSLGAMIASVELADAASCWWWFRYGFWLAGSSIAGGLAVDSVEIRVK